MKKALKIIVTLISVVFLLWFLAPLYYRIINPGNILGIIICCYLIFRFGFQKKYEELRSYFMKKKPAKILWRVLNICLSVFGIYAVLISGLMIYCASVSPVENSTAIVLGAQVKNGKASVLLYQRYMAAESYLDSSKNSVAVLSGGQGNDEAISEAQCMYVNMLADNIESERLYQENKSKNTYENIRFSYEILNKENLNKNLAIVTDSYHQLRARLIAKKQNINTEIGAVNTQNNFVGLITYPTFFVREWIAIPVELLK